LCTGHSGGGLSVVELVGIIEEPDNPMFGHYNKVQLMNENITAIILTATFVYNGQHLLSMTSYTT